MEGVKILYRLEVYTKLISNIRGNKIVLCSFKNTFYHKKYKVIKETDKSWIIKHLNQNKVISKTSLKKFAYATKLEAVDNFKKRKYKQIEYISIQEQRAKSQLYDLGVLNYEQILEE